MENVLITGASGLIGSNLLNRLKARGTNNIRVTAHKKNLIDKDIEILTGDLQNEEFCNKVTKNIDTVFHCAAVCVGVFQQNLDPTSILTPNIVMHSQLLNAAYKAKVKKFLWISSTSGYPFVGNQTVKEEQFFDDQPHDKYFAYGWMSRYIETLCRLYSEKLSGDMLCICPRASSVIGPSDRFDPERSHVFSALLKKTVCRNDPFVIWGTGNEVRDFIYVDDLIDAIFLAIEKLTSFCPLNIAYGKSFSIKELAELFFKSENFYPTIEYQNNGPTSIPARYLDNSKAKTMLGWAPKTSIEDAIVKTINWYKSNNY